ncbi:hypothetical protein GOODEAATRI_009573, partial [Goodea atripinnis]
SNKDVSPVGLVLVKMPWSCVLTYNVLVQQLLSWLAFTLLPFFPGGLFGKQPVAGLPPPLDSWFCPKGFQGTAHRFLSANSLKQAALLL